MIRISMLLGAILALGLLAGSGCPVPQPIPDPAHTVVVMADLSTPAVADLASRPSGAKACAVGTAMPGQSAVCDGRFTADLLACVRCKVTSGCVLHEVPGLGEVGVYCVATCNDTACSAVAAKPRKK